MGLAKQYRFADGVSVSKLGNVFLIKQKDRVLSLDPENQAHWSVIEALSRRARTSKREQRVFFEENQGVLDELEGLDLICSGQQSDLVKSTKVYFAQNSTINRHNPLPTNIDVAADEAQADLSVLIQAENSLKERIEFCESLIRQVQPGLIAFVDGHEFRIGPFILPGETACENCLVHRSAAWAPSPDLQVAIGNAIVVRQADPGTTDIVRSLVNAQISNFHNGELSGCLYNKVLFGSVIDWAFDMHAVYRFPFCRICSVIP